MVTTNNLKAKFHMYFHNISANAGPDASIVFAFILVFHKSFATSNLCDLFCKITPAFTISSFHVDKIVK